MKFILLLSLMISSSAFASTSPVTLLHVLEYADAQGDCGAGTCGIEVTDVTCSGTTKKAKCKFTSMDESILKVHGRRAGNMLWAMVIAGAGSCDAKDNCSATTSSIDCTYRNGPTPDVDVRCYIAPRTQMQ